MRRAASSLLICLLLGLSLLLPTNTAFAKNKPVVESLWKKINLFQYLGHSFSASGMVVAVDAAQNKLFINSSYRSYKIKNLPENLQLNITPEAKLIEKNKKIKLAEVAVGKKIFVWGKIQADGLAADKLIIVP